MEVRTGIIIIGAVTASIGMIVIFAGCNASHPEFDFTGEGAYSIPKQCEGDTYYNKCIERKTARENTCADYFHWLRY